MDAVLMQLIINGAATGPYTLDEVRTLWREAKISAQTLFWRPGQSDWQPLGTIAMELFPEALPASRPSTSWLAGFWARLLAIFIDLIILGAIGSIIGGFFFDALAQMGNWGKLIGFFVLLAYFGLMESALGDGRTLGKRLCRLRVVGRDGRGISVPRSLGRTLVWLIPYSMNGLTFGSPVQVWVGVVAFVVLITLLFAFPYLYVFNGRTRQSLQDLLTDTYVVQAQPRGIVDVPRSGKGIWR